MKSSEALIQEGTCKGKILMLSFDSLGDIVLRQPLFTVLVQKGYQVTVAVRKGFENILPVLDERLSVMTVDINPYREITESISLKLEQLTEEIRNFDPDDIICCPYQRTFLDEWILRKFRTSRRYGFKGICFPYDKKIGVLLPAVDGDLLDVAVESEERDWDIDKNGKLLSIFLGEDIEIRPCIAIDASIIKKTDNALENMGIERGNYVIVCPAGISNVRMKTWSIRNYAALIDFIIDRCGLAVLVICHETELDSINDILTDVKKPDCCRVWVGQQTDMDVLVGILGASMLYFGNDTGPMHIAAALNKPLIALMGGGTWPRFLPSAEVSAVFTQELPCFYCRWEYCIFEDAPCIKQIDPEAVKHTVRKMLAGEISGNHVHKGDPDIYQKAKTAMKGRSFGTEDLMPFNIILHGLPKISIVTPSYNQGQYLEECIDSVLSQNYPNLEYIVMDGGSTDNSTEIIRKYEKYLTYWQSESDGGHYQALNTGFKRSSGEIMAWLNSDDKYHPDALFSAAYVFLKRDDIEWIMGRPSNWDAYGNLRDIYPEIPLWSRKMYLSRIYRDPTIQQESVFWRRSLWEKTGGYIDHNYELAGDLELWRRFFRYAGLITVDALLGGFRNHPDQKTQTRLNDYFKEAEAIIEDEITLFDHGQFTDIPDGGRSVEISDKIVKNFKRSVGKLGYDVSPIYSSSVDIRLDAARKALVTKEWGLIKKQNDILHLESLLKESELDRRKRLEQIEELTRQLTESEADRKARLDALNEREARLAQVETERQLQIQNLTTLLKESNLDREKRLEQIDTLTLQLTESNIDRERRWEQIVQLTSWLETSEADRNARLERIQYLERCLDTISRKFDTMEQTYRALENTPVVRAARRMRLIGVKPLDNTIAYGETPDGTDRC